MTDETKPEKAEAKSPQTGHDFDQTLTLLNGNHVTHYRLRMEPPPGVAEEGDEALTKWANEPATLGEACMHAVLNVNELDAKRQPVKLSESEKFERYKLAAKLSKGGTVDLDKHDLARIRKTTAAGYPPEVMGTIWMVLGIKPKGRED